MAVDQQLSLKWNNHLMSYGQLLKDLCFNESYSDATLVCQETYYPVHKMVLSNCSQYFKSIFDHAPCKHPLIVLKDIQTKEMELLLKFIYHGEVNASQVDLPALLDGAEYLRIEGLSVYDGNESHLGNPSNTPRKKTKRKYNTQSPRKAKKMNFESVDFECLEPDTILHSENNGNVADSGVTNSAETEEKEKKDDDVYPKNKTGEENSAPSKVGGEYFCPMCSYSTRKSFNISRHIMRNHTGEKPYACHLCSYRSVETSQLTNHIERNHSGNKPFLCCHCSFGTITLRNLKRHLKLHEKDPMLLENALHEESALHEEKQLQEESQLPGENQTHGPYPVQEEKLLQEPNRPEEISNIGKELLEEENEDSEDGSSQVHTASALPNARTCASPAYTSHFMTHSDHSASHSYPS